MIYINSIGYDDYLGAAVLQDSSLLAGRDSLGEDVASALGREDMPGEFVSGAYERGDPIAAE